MNQVPYIDYKDLDEFYTIRQLADLLNISKSDLKKKCEQHDIKQKSSAFIM